MCTGHRHGLETERTQCTLHPGVEVSSELRALRTDTCGPAKGSSRPAASGAGSKRCKPPGLGWLLCSIIMATCNSYKWHLVKKTPTLTSIPGQTSSRSCLEFDVQTCEQWKGQKTRRGGKEETPEARKTHSLPAGVAPSHAPSGHLLDSLCQGTCLGPGLNPH